MTGKPSARVTQILAGLQESESRSDSSTDQLFEVVYPELRRLAASYMAGERTGHTLQPTALVSEAYLKLADVSRIDWRGKTHFFAVGANIMRRLLIDHARGRGRVKRGGDWKRVTLAHSVVAGGSEIGLDASELLNLDRALEKLHGLDKRQARIVELRFFGGLSVAEVAESLGVSKRTVEGDWAHAKAWLRRELSATHV